MQSMGSKLAQAQWTACQANERGVSISFFLPGSVRGNVALTEGGGKKRRKHKLKSTPSDNAVGSTQSSGGRASPLRTCCDYSLC